MSGYHDVRFTSSLNSGSSDINTGENFYKTEKVTFLDDNDRRPLENTRLPIRGILCVVISLFSVFTFIMVYINMVNHNLPGQPNATNSNSTD